MGKKIEDQSNAKDDAALPQRDRKGAGQRMAQRRGDDKAVGFSVTGRTGAQRDGHPDGWQTGGRE